MATTCKNPTCNDRAWWAGWCRLCWQVTGVGEQHSANRRAEQQATQQAAVDAEIERARASLHELGTAGKLAWWEISEQLNAAGHRLSGVPFTPATARGAYLVMTAHEWE